MKKNNIIKRIGLGCIVILFTYACGVPKVTQRNASAPLPEQYQSNMQDTVNDAQIVWKDFFEDPYLVQLIDAALVNNKELNMMLQKVNMAQNEVQARKGEYLPSISAGLGADVDKVGRYTRNGAVEHNLEIEEGKEFPEPLSNLQGGLYMSWELDVWKKLRNSKKAAYMEYMASVEGKKFLVTSLIAEIADSYYELLALDSKLSNLEQNINLQKDALRMVELLRQAARTTSLAVKRFEAEVQKNQSEVFRLKQEIVEVENRLAFLVGQSSVTIQRSTGEFTALSPKVVHTGIPSQLLANRPDIKQAELELEAAKLNIKVAKANFYPSFGMKAGVGYQAFNTKYLLTTPESVFYSVAGEIVAPLVNRNAIKADYKNANAKQIQSAFEYEQTIIKAYQEVSTQLSKMANLEQEYQLKNEQVDLLKESITVANQLFQSARADYMEVLLTQRDALEARTVLIETKKEQMLTMVNLYKALGGGWK
ncbi:TolC family protein [Confluentibacter lentus]|uniref:TolC family protein n=1 Tax=Confluentibacter lentus TaxID=1699412 RepID=UPI000C28B05A|nr:efflux transporter outer membrane subunit [Confluentibacter lentus]